MRTSDSSMFIVGLAVMIAIALSVPLETPAAANTLESGPVAEAVLRIGFLDEIDSLNPYLALSDASQVFFSLVYDCLQGVGNDLAPTPNLANELWIVPTTDPLMIISGEPYGSVWQYNLTQNALWSDGAVLTAYDVAFNLNLNAQNFENLWAYEPYSYRMYWAEEVSVFTLRIHYFDRQTAEPVPVAYGSQINIPILSRLVLQDLTPSMIGFSWDGTPIVGTGPFMPTLDTYTEWASGGPITLLRNPNYHGWADYGQLVHFDSVSLHFFDDVATMSLALQESAIDVASFPREEYLSLKGMIESGALADVTTFDGIRPDNYFINVLTNMNDAGPNPSRLDPTVRQALAISTNKSHIVDEFYYGLGEEGSTLMSPVNDAWHYEPGLGEMFEFNKVAAAALLEGAGYVDTDSDSVRECTLSSLAVQMNWAVEGTHLEYDLLVRQGYPEEFDVAQYLESEWGEIGVDVTLVVLEEYMLASYVYGYEYDMAIWCWTASPDPDYILFAQSERSWCGWSDTKYTSLDFEENYNSSVSALSPSERKTYVDACQLIHYTDCPYIILTYPNQTMAWRTDTFTGWGDWSSDPGRSIFSTWSGNPLYFDLTPISTQNDPPSITGLDVSPNPCLVLQEVSFEVSVSDPDGDPLVVTIDFGDGEMAVEATAGGTPSTQTALFLHAYADQGTYSATVWANDGLGPSTHNVTSYFEDCITVLGGSEGQKIDYRMYDMFEQPWGEWWYWRLHSVYDTDLILSNEPHKYTMVYNPDKRDIRGIITAPYRWNVSAVNMSTINVHDPAIMPVFGPAVEGSRAQLNVYFEYLNTAWWNDYWLPAWSSDDEWTNSIAESMDIQQIDGYLLGTVYTATMNREAAETWMNMPPSADPMTWWAANSNTYRNAWSAWIEDQGNNVFDIYAGYVWPYVDLGTMTKLSVVGDEIVLTIAHINYGYEVLMTRWMTDRAICTHEPFMEDFQLSAQYESGRGNLTYDGVAQWSLQAVKANGTENAAAWAWRPEKVDRIEYPDSEYNEYAYLTHTSWNSGDEEFGNEVPYVYTPTYFNLTSDMTFTIQLPDRGDVLAYRGLPLPDGSINDLRYHGNTAPYEQISHCGPMWLGWHGYPEVPGAPDLSSMYNNYTKALVMQGPLGFENYHHGTGQLYHGAPWIEFDVANYTWPGNVEDLSPVADAGDDILTLAGVEATFDSSNSYDDVGIVNWTWTFWYDGGWEQLYGPSPRFTFLIEGVYEVTLTVKDVLGQTDTDAVTVTVSGVIPEFGSVTITVIASMVAIALMLANTRRRRRRGLG